MNAPFGLAAVDFETQKRTFRPCVKRLKRLFAQYATEPQAQDLVCSTSDT
ncbi:MAG: hypothetical protein ACE15E_11830 [Acidobacteriota bacterium]